MSKKANLAAAKKAKNDEFYTQLVDIENEVKHYKPHFKGKVVLCNCDDPKESQFAKYFRSNFHHLGLKKLIITHYKDTNLSKAAPYRLDYVPAKSKKGRNTTKSTKMKLVGDGDFRSPEAVAALSEADIVVTNPPFSLFREYIDQLITHDKKFLVIGNMNAITYKEVFKLIQQDKVWLGNSHPKTFRQPNNTFKTFGNIEWFTNLPHKKRNDSITLYKTYTPQEFPKYDNYNAIEVSKVADIPVNYSGEMGVPITFLGKYNPKQFEIVRFRKGNDDKDLSIKGKFPYFRIVIKRK